MESSQAIQLMYVNKPQAEELQRFDQGSLIEAIWLQAKLAYIVDLILGMPS